MKTCCLIGGTMGAGKSTVFRCCKKLPANSVFLDGEWRWDAHPFRVTDETKEMVMQNICALWFDYIIAIFGIAAVCAAAIFNGKKAGNFTYSIISYGSRCR